MVSYVPGISVSLSPHNLAATLSSSHLLTKNAIDVGNMHSLQDLDLHFRNRIHGWNVIERVL